MTALPILDTQNFAWSLLPRRNIDLQKKTQILCSLNFFSLATEIRCSVVEHKKDLIFTFMQEQALQNDQNKNKQTNETVQQMNQKNTPQTTWAHNKCNSTNVFTTQVCQRKQEQKGAPLKVLNGLEKTRTTWQKGHKASTNAHFSHKSTIHKWATHTLVW